MEKAKVFVACHKGFEMPIRHAGFQPIHVGAEKSEVTIAGALRDDSGDNISAKNSIYCELTGLYWIWKNYSDAEYIGLCHYRRFFAKKAYSIKDDYSILPPEQLVDAICGYDIILPTPATKTAGNHYFENEADYEADRVFIEITSAVKELCPEYLQTSIDVLKSKSMSFGNIMFANRNVFDSYCSWLFKMETYLERFIVERFGEIEPREMGFISEWLLNIWAIHNNLRIKYVPLCMINDDNKFVRYLKQIREKL